LAHPSPRAAAHFIWRGRRNASQKGFKEQNHEATFRLSSIDTAALVEIRCHAGDCRRRQELILIFLDFLLSKLVII
jgi:hypothetical protein